MRRQIEIVFNGTSRMIPDAWSVDELLSDLELSGAPVAVELNERIVPREHWASRALCEGDRLEVVHFVGGG